MKEIPLTRGRVALVDDEDFDAVICHRWHCAVRPNGRCYARTSIGRGRVVYMHRLIMQAPPHMDIDHANRDGLDNRRGNLRVCTRGENLRNSTVRRDSKTGYKGVSYHGHGLNRPWMAHIHYNGKHLVIGYYRTPEEAAIAHDHAVRYYHGVFARTNT